MELNPGSDTAASIAAIRAMLAQAGGTLEKATGTFTQPGTATTGLQTYNLEPAAKNLYPVYSPIRNRTSRVKATGGLQANWKAVINPDAGLQSIGVSEGNRGALIQVQTADYFAAFKTIGLESSVTKEAELSAEGFDDLKARAVNTLLQDLMMGEERLILGGNTSVPLGQTPQPTLVASTTGGTIAASTLVSVICVALTMDGLRTASVTGGVQGLVTRTNTDGSTDQYGGGAAMASVNATVTTGGSTATNLVTATAAAVQGAVAYAWYVGSVVGQERCYAITNYSAVQITAFPTNTNPMVPTSVLTADNSACSLYFDGLITMNAKTQNYNGINAKWIVPTGTPSGGVGVTLTSDGLGGIIEFDQMLQWFWDVLRMSPDRIIMNSQQALDIRKKILGSTSAQTSRFQFVINQGQIVGGGIPKGYMNPFANGTGPAELALEIHPYLPNGTILFLADKLPYPMNNVPELMRILGRQDYYQYEWPMRSRKYEYGVYSDEVLQHYFPVSIGVISNIAPF
jgi:hypothetical protein